MIQIKIPTKAAVLASANSVGFITDGLDAVVVENHYDVENLCMHLTIAGNDRDLGIAMERAIKIGGEMD